jgi:hypothetical protein
VARPNLRGTFHFYSKASYAYWFVSNMSSWARPRTVSIDIFDGNSILHVVLSLSAIFLVEDDIAGSSFERWKSQGLFLLCTYYDTPVADTQAHSPLLPPIVCYFRKDRELTTAEDKDGIILALKHVRRVRLYKLVQLCRGLLRPWMRNIQSLNSCISYFHLRTIVRS